MSVIEFTKIYIVDMITYPEMSSDNLFPFAANDNSANVVKLPSDAELLAMKPDEFKALIKKTDKSVIAEIENIYVLDRIVKFRLWPHKLNKEQLNRLKKEIYNIPDYSLKDNHELLQSIIDGFKQCSNITILPRKNETNKTEWFKERMHLTDDELKLLITYVQPNDFDKCLRSSRGDILGDSLIIFTIKHPIEFDNVTINDPTLYVKIDYEDMDRIIIVSIHGEAENKRAAETRESRRNKSKQDTSGSSNIVANTYRSTNRQFWSQKISNSLKANTRAMDISCHNCDDYSNWFTGSVSFCFSDISCSFQLDIVDNGIINSVDDFVFVVNFLYDSVINSEWSDIVRYGEIFELEFRSNHQYAYYVEDNDDELRYDTYGNWQDNLSELFFAIDNSL